MRDSRWKDEEFEGLESEWMMMMMMKDEEIERKEREKKSEYMFSGHISIKG